MLEPSKNRANVEKRGNCWQQKTKLEKILSVGIVSLALLAVIFLILYATKRSCSVSQDECTTKHCVQAASELLNFIDLKQDPCENFYQYVCGHYMKEAVKKGAPTPILELDHEFKNELKSIIVDDIKKKDTKSTIAMKKFYKACMNESAIDADENRVFLKNIENLGGWPLHDKNYWKYENEDFDWIEWYTQAVQTGFEMDGVFEFRPAATDRNKTVLRVTNNQLEDDDIGVIRDNFIEVMNTVGEVFHIGKGTIGSDIAEIYAFLKKIVDIEDITEEFDEDEANSTVLDLYEECPQFDWLKLLNGLSGKTLSFTNETEVIFGVDINKYCEKLDKILKKTPKQIIANYFIWSIINNQHIFMSKKIRTVYEDFKKKSGDRFNVCYKTTDEKFKYLKETVYIRKKTKPEVRKELDELIEIMKDVFEEHVKKSTWMDEETKKRGVEKAQLIEKIIGADEILYDVEKFDKIIGVDELEFSDDESAFEMVMAKNRRENQQLWESVYVKTPENWQALFENANQVNAFFAMSLNLMIIPAPILNSVFFNYKMPTYMNYGAIGRVVGHEIMHGFGENGRMVTLEDDEEVDWWTNNTAEAFQKTKQCVIEEYEKIPFRYNLNGTLTLEENLADFVGIDVAYEAYLRWEKKYGEEKKLPGIPLTPKQIFWIQTGTFLCFRKLDDDAIDLTVADEHAIPGFRVTAGARNSLYFAKDFNCPVGSFMNPEEKCRIL